jgi:hypothetical protein
MVPGIVTRARLTAGRRAGLAGCLLSPNSTTAAYGAVDFTMTTSFRTTAR